MDEVARGEGKKGSLDLIYIHVELISEVWCRLQSEGI